MNHLIDCTIFDDEAVVLAFASSSCSETLEQYAERVYIEYLHQQLQTTLLQ